MNLYKRIKTSLTLRLYRSVYIPLKANQIRKKNTIKVVFVVWSLGSWKSENLYLQMIKHPRFNPQLVIGPSHEEDFEILKSYCTEKKYEVDIVKNLNSSFWNKYKPDIIFYNKPYTNEFLLNLRSLFCYVPYGFRCSVENWALFKLLLCHCWQIYYENKELSDYYSSRLYKGVYNGYGTGIPPMDELLKSKSEYEDPWPTSEGKKRIIYAPHHTIQPKNKWQTSSFLETGELMLELAEKYSDKVQWVFKPHPMLRVKLNGIWGNEKTDRYFDKWANSSWSSFQNGEYQALFKYSDALIHDCGSFMFEYHSTGNPVMYLLREKIAENKWNETAYQAYNLHYKGRTQSEIEQFIQNVINGIDPLKEERKNFFLKNLTPPFNRTACENIIDCILSKDAKKKYR